MLNTDPKSKLQLLSLSLDDQGLSIMIDCVL